MITILFFGGALQEAHLLVDVIYDRLQKLRPASAQRKDVPRIEQLLFYANQSIKTLY